MDYALTYEGGLRWAHANLEDIGSLRSAAAHAAMVTTALGATRTEDGISAIQSLQLLDSTDVAPVDPEGGRCLAERSQSPRSRRVAAAGY